MHIYTNVREFAFDGAYGDKNPNKGDKCVMLDWDFDETCGTDCLVGYIYESREQCITLMMERTGYDRSIIEGWVEQGRLEDWGFENDDAMVNIVKQFPFVLIQQEELCELKPDTALDAHLLMLAARTSYLRWKTRDLTGVDRKWFYNDHVPYMQRKLGAAYANCVEFLYSDR